MTTPLAMMGICDVAPEHGDLGLTEARIVAPGEPGRSTLTARMRTSGPDRMPDIGSLVVDEAGAALIEAWIEAMTGCP
jgi:hypothetical protein